MRILLTNDDGYNAHGIQALYDYLKDDHEVWIIAPDGERSATSHSLSLQSILRLKKKNEFSYSCTGFPADCIHLGFQTIMKEKRPDLVLSGINRGSNLGQDIYYSGTVAGAREACFRGVPAVSLSLDVASGQKAYYENLFPLLGKIIDEKIYQDIPKYCSLNINAPNIKGAGKDWEYCELGFAAYDGTSQKALDPKGQEYYWLSSGKRLIESGCDRMDVYWVEKGKVSVSPCAWIPNKQNDFTKVAEKLSRVTKQ